MGNNFWRDSTGEHYVKVKANHLTEYLKDKEIFDDNPWASIAEVQKELGVSEFEVVGIVMYMWLIDEVKTKAGDNGELMIHIYG